MRGLPMQQVPELGEEPARRDDLARKGLNREDLEQHTLILQPTVIAGRNQDSSPMRPRIADGKLILTGPVSKAVRGDSDA